MAKLKPLRDQVIVITGASSGIGLVTARTAAKAGAKVVLAARSEEALRELESELNANGAVALAVPTDVADQAAVSRLADAALDRFGRIDTWVNDAGVSIYGNIEQVPVEDAKRLFETNYWGVVNGSLEAVKHLKSSGGALINIGSTLSDRAIPIQGHYSASKHAVKGFTDALRMELEADKVPISVTLIKPAGINTPYTQHAKNFMVEEPNLPPPVYDPQLVANAILHAATHKVRDLFVGSAGKAISAAGHYAPRLADYFMEGPMIAQQKKPNTWARNREGALYSAGNTLKERGDYPGYVRKTSLYTASTKHPLITLTLASLAGAAVVAALSSILAEDETTAQKLRRKAAALW